MHNDEPDFDTRRFIIAMVLSGAVLIGWQMWFGPEPPTQPPGEGGTATQTDGKQDDGKQEVADDGSKAGDMHEEHAADDQVDPEDKADLGDTVVAAPDRPVLEHTIATDRFEVTTSSRGARVASARIVEPERFEAAGDLLGKFPEKTENYPFGVTFAGDSIPMPKELVYAFVEEESEKTGDHYTKVVYRHSDPEGRFVLDKIYSVRDEPYQLDFEVRLTNNMDGARISDVLALDLYGYKDPEEETSFFDIRADEVEAVCQMEEDVEREVISGIESPLSFQESAILWGGIDRRYFMIAAVPDGTAVKCTMEVVDTNYLRTRLFQDDFSIGSGESYGQSYQLYLGPKDYDILEEAGHKLEEAVDYGIFTFLARPLRWALKLFYGWVGNWGLAILLLTLIIRVLLFPINQKVYQNSERMKEIQPQLKVVREKYEDDQTKLAEETMKLFKENDVSPMGCLPMFLQFPILLALYFMILNSVELYQADFMLWYTDLSAHDPYYVLPVLMGVVMFVQQSFMQMETPNPQMKLFMKIMPLSFTVFMLFLPSGVVLYYSMSLVLGLGQQFWIKRKFANKRAEAA